MFGFRSKSKCYFGLIKGNTMSIGVVVHRWITNQKVYKNNCNNERDYKIWIFGEWFGKKCSDNVMYFANYVAKHGDQNLKLFWLCNNGVDTSDLNEKIEVVDRLSDRAVAIQKLAGVAFMNQGYGDFSDSGDNYLGNAITVNLWHGVMWKRIGFDSFPSNLLSTIYINSIKKPKQFSYYCSPSEVYKNIFSRAFRTTLENAIDVGLPRNELFFDSRKIMSAKEKLLVRMREMGLDLPDDIKIIAYMPTFRDGNKRSFSFTDINNEDLERTLAEHNCFIIQKAHEVNVNRGVGYGIEANKRVINIDNIPPQELLASSDILVTDYSSCFFDYLLLDRPIIQFIYDYDYYRNSDRGLYYEYERVDCGAIVKDTDSLINAIREGLMFPEKKHINRERVKREFMTYESADNSRLIYETIIRKISGISQKG